MFACLVQCSLRVEKEFAHCNDSINLYVNIDPKILFSQILFNIVTNELSVKPEERQG